MRKLVLVLVAVLAFNLSNAQVKNVFKESSYLTYNTDKYGEVDVTYSYEQKNNGDALDDETIKRLIDEAISLTKSTLKSRRSFVPMTITFKYVNHPKGKNRYKVNIWYEATNSYGGAVESVSLIEFNKKFRETVGSLMSRMN